MISRELGRSRRAALVAVLLMGGMFAVGRASADVSREVRHERFVRSVCEHPNHWYREHGISVIIEACEA